MPDRHPGPLSFIAAAALISSLVAPPAHAAGGDCSQPVSTGDTPIATDCLLILQIGVGVASCPFDPCVCTPSGSFPTSATDALVCLQIATGLGGSLGCPCSNDCEDGVVPICGGDCGAGEVCAPDPFDPINCTCLDSCEQGPAPQCGGDCTGDNEGGVCSALELSTGGGPSEDLCLCLPEQFSTCESAGAPNCFGACRPGTQCVQEGNDCICSALPLQGPCAGASAPACGGTCSDGFVCENNGGTCGCNAFVEQRETCHDADGPTCGGACAHGDFCTVDIGGGSCDCFEPCEISDTPSCGGACSDARETCALQVASLDAMTLSFCGCVLE